jgi:hypothetical protein
MRDGLTRPFFLAVPGGTSTTSIQSFACRCQRHHRSAAPTVKVIAWSFSMTLCYFGVMQNILEPGHGAYRGRKA